jgi:NAD(P)-dependent dehydrogenase (short-subunit alcohol dehydrogenase family)
LQVVPAVKHIQFDSNASYLLAGGIGGIGRGLARYMAGLKCKNLIMVSRSAEQHAEGPDLVQELAAVGCKAWIFNCDVADLSSFQDLLARCTRQGIPPIRGVVQAAMALHVSLSDKYVKQQH